MPPRLALITYLDEAGSPGIPDNSLPGYGGGRPARPDHELPGGGHISTLPVFPFDPTKPDNTLPGGGHPSTGPIVPGMKFIVKWLACTGLILVPDNSLPGTGGSPDNELPETPEPKY